MSEIEKLLTVAQDEIGYLEKSRSAYESNPEIVYEKKAGAGTDNITKYAKDMDNLKVYNSLKQGYPWCKIFVDWCLVQAFGIDRTIELLIGWTAGCEEAWNCFRANNNIVFEPQKGDLIFFGKQSHIGIVEDVDDDRVYTIEGNTSNRAELVTNGGQVARKSYLKSSGYIDGYARLDYKIPPKIEDWDLYYWLYEDLRKALPYDFNVLSNHYKEFGIKEGRTSGYVFDPKFYVEKYEDLKITFGEDWKELYNHFFEFGITEGRIGNIVFDVTYYKAHNPDLVNMTNEEAINHFLQFGINEFRETSEYFNVNIYKENNIDLQEAFGNNSKEYYKHFLMLGKDEGRIYN